MTEDDTHEQWRQFQIDAPPAKITIRQAYYRAVAEGLIEAGPEGYEIVKRYRGFVDDDA